MSSAEIKVAPAATAQNIPKRNLPAQIIHIGRNQIKLALSQGGKRNKRISYRQTENNQK